MNQAWRDHGAKPRCFIHGFNYHIHRWDVWGGLQPWEYTRACIPSHIFLLSSVILLLTGLLFAEVFQYKPV